MSTRNLQIASVIASTFLLATSTNIFAEPVCIDLSGVSECTSVEGLGTVHSALDIVNIASDGGSIVKIVEGSTNCAAYGSGYGTGSLKGPINGGIISSGGFSNQVLASNNKKHGYGFLFPYGISEFQLMMRDFGDWNPSNATNHVVLMEAFDSNNVRIDSMKLEYNTPAQGNPTSSDLYGPLYTSSVANGDALNVPPNEPAAPGVWKWTVQATPSALGVQYPDIVKVSLTFGSGFDPKIGFDSLCFDEDVIGLVEVEIDIKPNSYPNSLSINDHGVIPVAINGSDQFDVTAVDVSTLNFAGLGVRVKGNGNPQCAIEDWNGDGFDDLVCKFVDDADAWEPGEDVAFLYGLLLDGTPFEGSDSINVVN